MGIVPAAQPTSRRVKALRLREPLMRRQMAGRVERRKREDEDWARIEDEEQMLRRTKGRGRVQDGRDTSVGEDRKQAEVLERARVLEEELRKARVDERRRMLRRAAEGRTAVPTGRRRADQREEGDDAPPMDERSRQGELYVRQRLARKVGGFADIVAMSAKDPVPSGEMEAGATDAVGERDGEASRRVGDEVSFVVDDQWDF